MLTLRSFSASRVVACGRLTGRSATESIGAVTSRMMTSTSATSMSGVMLGFVIISDHGCRRRAILPPDHGDRRRALRFGLVEHGHEIPVRDLVGAGHHHLARGARIEQRLEL